MKRDISLPQLLNKICPVKPGFTDMSSVITMIVIALFLLSLKYHFLDVFVVGAWHGEIGVDFFSIPRAFLNLQFHKSIFNTNFLSYGPYASWYPYHPALAIFVGAPLSLFEPWAAYGIFVIFSIIVLMFSARLIAKYFKGKPYQNIPYPLIMATFPTYLMLWNAQMHIFTVLSVTLILVSYLERLENPLIHKIDYKLFFGLLVSLLSKPIVLLFLPVILFMKETRRTCLICLVVYAAISLLFIFNSFLNSEDINFLHWVNIIYQSNNLTNNKEYFSLPSLINTFTGYNNNLIFYKIPLVLILILSLGVFFIKADKVKARYSLLIIIATLFCYFISYNKVWEYHYTTVLPAIPVMLFLCITETDNIIRFLLKSALIVSITFYLPTTYFMYKYTMEHRLVQNKFL